MAIARTLERATKPSVGRRVVAIALVPVSAFVAVFVALLDRATVTSAADLRAVKFGEPIAWLTQDQTALTPPFPIQVEPGSPITNPTSVDFGALFLDITVAYAVLLVLIVIGRSIYRRVYGDH